MGSGAASGGARAMQSSLDMLDSWDSLKARARTLQGACDAGIQELGKMASKLNGEARAGIEASPERKLADSQIARVAELKEQIEADLREFGAVKDKLARAQTSPAQQAQVNRYREIHTEMSRDFRRTASSIDQYLQRRSLIGGRSREGRASAGGDEDPEAQLMREGALLGNSLSMTDEVIASASATRAMLQNQNASFGGIRSKMLGVASMVPGLDRLIGNISQRQQQENMILAATTAVCLSFTLWYKFL